MRFSRIMASKTLCLNWLLLKPTRKEAVPPALPSLYMPIDTLHYLLLPLSLQHRHLPPLLFPSFSSCQSLRWSLWQLFGSCYSPDDSHERMGSMAGVLSRQCLDEWIKNVLNFQDRTTHFQEKINILPFLVSSMLSTLSFLFLFSSVAFGANFNSTPG
jgi:hypothetical protein